MDRKADFVGNHGGAYTDMDGMRKQFTTIDHDKKLSISAGLISPDSDFDIKVYRAELQKRIVDLPPVYCHEWFQDFTTRGTKIEWNMDMLLDSGVPIEQLRSLCVIAENRAESSGKLK